MNKTDILACQSSFRAFARVDHWAAPHAVTLTMRQGDVMQTQKGATYVELTRDIASHNYRHFLNVLSRAVIGQAAKRYGRRVNSISVFEGGGSKRLHIHAVVDCPVPELSGKFPGMIKESWKKTSWGQAEINIQPNADDGWVEYISKFRDKPNFLESIDWINCHTVDCRV